VLSLHEPSAGELAARRGELSGAPLAAPADLIDRVDDGRRPAAWFHDESGGSLGDGEHAWRAAMAAVERWAFYDQQWLRLSRPPRIEVGALAAMIVRVGPVWFTNWCRITERIDEDDCFGFVYVTLDDHAEAGAERFLVTRAADGEVRWELTAVSRPGTWFTWIGQPAVRALQARFRKGALAAMRRAVSAATQPT
jgi:uncharacterized protein (UPF0548 family)